MNRILQGRAQNKANLSRVGARKSASKPKTLTLPPGTGASAPNKANWPALTGNGQRPAKSPGKSRARPTVQNKANSPHCAGTGGGGQGRREAIRASIVRNKANFAPRDRIGCGSARAPGEPAGGQACETKPISSEHQKGQVLCRKRGVTHRAKQSQFPPEGQEATVPREEVVMTYHNRPRRPCRGRSLLPVPAAKSAQKREDKRSITESTEQRIDDRRQRTEGSSVVRSPLSVIILPAPAQSSQGIWPVDSAPSAPSAKSHPPVRFSPRNRGPKAKTAGRVFFRGPPGVIISNMVSRPTRHDQHEVFRRRLRWTKPVSRAH